LPQFDFNTVADVILHLRYTAREGGEPLKQAVVRYIRTALNEFVNNEGAKGLAQIFSLRHDFPDDWRRFVTVADENGRHTQAFSLAKDRFPLVFQGQKITITAIDLFGVPKADVVSDEALETLTLTSPPDKKEVKLDNGAEIGRLVHKMNKQEDDLKLVVEVKNAKGKDKQAEADWTLTVAKDNVTKCLDPLEDIIILCRYEVTGRP